MYAMIKGVGGLWIKLVSHTNENETCIHLPILSFYCYLGHHFYLRRQRRNQVQESGHSVRLSVRPYVPKSCHRNSSETTDLIILKLCMQIGHHMQLCISAGNFDPLIFVRVMPLGTQKILINDLVIATPLKLLIRFS